MDSLLTARIEQIIAALHPNLIQMRRDFYMHPELSGEESRTARVVAARLRALGLTVDTGIGGYGVVGVLRGAHPGPVIAYRADMDALPIQDALATPYRSLALGVKHACGHDVHTTIALGLAEVLAALRDDLAGTVKFIFQPAEESLDGARAMIADGVLVSPTPEKILAMHVFPLPVGAIGVAESSCLAGMEEFRVRFYCPAGAFDTLVAKAISALSALSTGIPPVTPEAFDALLCSMRSGGMLDRTIFVSAWPALGDPADNDHLLGLVSIPCTGNVEHIRGHIRRTLDAVTAEVGASYDLAFTFSNPPLVNDAALVAHIAPVIRRIVGDHNVTFFTSPYPFSHEDFALYCEHLPGVLLWLGTANPALGISGLLHTPDFDVDESALHVGVRMMVAVLLHLLGT